MEFLNGVIPARMIKEVITNYNWYKIVNDINKMVLRLTYHKGYDMEVSDYISFADKGTTLKKFKKKVTSDIEKVKKEAKELGYILTFGESKECCTVNDAGVYLLYEVTLRFAEWLIALRYHLDFQRQMNT